MPESRVAIGRRIKRLRENLGLSRQQVAGHLAVDLTAVAAWEAGKYLPREGKRLRLAALLRIDVATLFAEQQQPSSPVAASLVDTLSELPGVLRRLLQSTEKNLRAFRLAAPYTTPAHVQEEFRGILDQRLMQGSLEVERIEIFYSLERLKEVLSNLLRYEDRPYRVKTACTGVHDVVPGMGGYLFDDDDMLIGGYWAKVPPSARPGLWLKGEPFKSYFADYWDEIWNRGTPLNGKDGADLDAVRQVALGMGLAESGWPQFVEDARNLEIGDGLPPLV